MASTYKATVHGDAFDVSNPLTGLQEDVSQDFSFTVAVALVLNDIIDLCKAPKGAILLDFIINIPDLDSDGAPAITLDLGDTGNNARFVSASTKGRSAATLCYVNDGVLGALPYTYTADDIILLKVHAAPATGATDVIINGTIRYNNRGLVF